MSHQATTSHQPLYYTLGCLQAQGTKSCPRQRSVASAFKASLAILVPSQRYQVWWVPVTNLQSQVYLFIKYIHGLGRSFYRNSWHSSNFICPNETRVLSRERWPYKKGTNRDLGRSVCNCSICHSLPQACPLISFPEPSQLINMYNKSMISHFNLPCPCRLQADECCVSPHGKHKSSDALVP